MSAGTGSNQHFVAQGLGKTRNDEAEKSFHSLGKVIGLLKGYSVSPRHKAEVRQTQKQQPVSAGLLSEQTEMLSWEHIRPSHLKPNSPVGAPAFLVLGKICRNCCT